MQVLQLMLLPYPAVNDPRRVVHGAACRRGLTTPTVAGMQIRCWLAGRRCCRSYLASRRRPGGGQPKPNVPEHRGLIALVRSHFPHISLVAGGRKPAIPLSATHRLLPIIPSSCLPPGEPAYWLGFRYVPALYLRIADYVTLPPTTMPVEV